jgi:hypothetical protein
MLLLKKVAPMTSNGYIKDNKRAVMHMSGFSWSSKPKDSRLLQIMSNTPQLRTDERLARMVDYHTYDVDMIKHIWNDTQVKLWHHMCDEEDIWKSIVVQNIDSEWCEGLNDDEIIDILLEDWFENIVIEWIPIGNPYQVDWHDNHSEGYEELNLTHEQFTPVEMLCQAVLMENKQEAHDAAQFARKMLDEMIEEFHLIWKKNVDN